MIEPRCVTGNLVVLGLGSIGATFLPLAERHIQIAGRHIAISAHSDQQPIAERHGYAYQCVTLTAANYREILRPLLVSGSLLINLSIEVSSAELMLLCRECATTYVDTATEPWPDCYGNPRLSMWERSNARFRADMLNRVAGPGPTAIATHGANPGWVNHMVKQGLLDIAAGLGENITCPGSREEWAYLARRLGLRTIQIAERDWQKTIAPVPDDVVANTWSAEGFVAEAYGQAGELGWGSHEGAPPPGAELHHGVLLLPDSMRPFEVKSWTPMSGEHDAMLVTHAESVSLSEYFSIGDKPAYRPTVYYAYRPIDEVWRSRTWPQYTLLNLPAEKKYVLRRDQIDDGVDELGVLLLGERFGAHWIGSTLSSAEADTLLPGFSATSLQVAAGVLSAAVYCLDHPNQGLLEPEDMDHQQALDILRHYLGKVVSVGSDWHPAGSKDYRFERFLLPRQAVRHEQ